MFNVSGWRSEPGQVVSDVTARLLRWMERAHLGAALSVDEVADEIHLGLCELMDASSAVVLSRPAADDVLLLMAASQSDFATLLTDFDIPRFPSRALIDERFADRTVFHRAGFASRPRFDWRIVGFDARFGVSRAHHESRRACNR